MPPSPARHVRYYDDPSTVTPEYIEPVDPPWEADLRSPWERDRDRLLHCSAFRRLAGVTQVVSPSEGHVFHNRLTHTLKVAQISHGIAVRLLKHQQPYVEEYGGLDPYAAEAAALAHDLGHPPFGHAAEYELDKLIKEQGIEDGYNGNAQSFRIVTRLSIRVGNIGLDLTCATLNGILKYPWLRDLTNTKSKRYKKWGAYNTEKEQFEWARALMPENARDVNTLEAEIMDWSDDIANAIYDLEDFYRAGLVPLEQLHSGRGLHNFLKAVAEHWEAIEDPDISDFDEFEKALVEVLESGPIREPYSGRRRHRQGIRIFTSYNIGEYIRSMRLNKPGSPRHIDFDPKAKREIKMLKEIIRHYIIDSPVMARQEKGAQRIVQELFKEFMTAAQLDNKKKKAKGNQYLIFPGGIRELFMELDQASIDEKISEEQLHEARVRLVSDTISTMTDNEAWRVYRRLVGTDTGITMDHRNGM